MRVNRELIEELAGVRDRVVFLVSFVRMDDTCMNQVPVRSKATLFIHSKFLLASKCTAYLAFYDY